jgi:DNA-binding transcriptional regulator PaaX
MVKKTNISKGILKKLASNKAVPFEVLQDSTKDSKKKYALSRSIKNLKNDGLVECFSSSNQDYIRLTKEGRCKLNQIYLDSENSLVSTEWDGYWRIIILDIPEERKSEREALRYLLKKAGFICVKNSVWISMYPFEHLFTNIKDDLNLTNELMILVTDKIDEKTKQEFIKYCIKKE